MSLMSLVMSVKDRMPLMSVKDVMLRWAGRQDQKDAEDTADHHDQGPLMSLVTLLPGGDHCQCGKFFWHAIGFARSVGAATCIGAVIALGGMASAGIHVMPRGGRGIGIASVATSTCIG